MRKIVLGLMVILCAGTVGCAQRQAYTPSYSMHEKTIQQWEFYHEKERNYLTAYDEIDYKALHNLAEQGRGHDQTFVIKLEGQTLFGSKEKLSDTDGKLVIPVVHIVDSPTLYDSNKKRISKRAGYYYTIFFDVNSNTVSGKDYIGTNAFGVTKRISKINTTGNLLLSERKISNDPWHREDYPSIYKSIDISPIEINSIELYAIIKIKENHDGGVVGTASESKSPTIDSPSDHTDKYNIVCVDIDTILVVDKIGKRILGRVRYR